MVNSAGRDGSLTKPKDIAADLGQAAGAGCDAPSSPEPPWRTRTSAGGRRVHRPLHNHRRRPYAPACT